MNWYKNAQTHKKLNIDTSESILYILKELNNVFGYKALFVGGCVRDAVISEIYGQEIKIKDIDVEVYGVSFAVLHNVLKSITGYLDKKPGIAKTNVDAVGAAFGVLKVTIQHEDGEQEDYDFSVPRRDSKIPEGGGHKAFEIEADPTMNPKEAASRRDFTINAMAFDPLTEEIHDYFGGIEDIKNKKLRATSEAFSEDSLRVLRGLQFAARFGFDLDEHTAEVCRECLKDAHTISTERIGAEWLKLFVKGKYPGKCLDFLVDSGWIKLYPEIEAMIGVEQGTDHHPEKYLEHHISQALNRASEIASEQGLNERNRAILLLSALCHDLGKPSTTRTELKDGKEKITSKGHQQEGVALAKSLIDRMGIERVLGKGIAEEVMPLVKYHMINATNEYEPQSAKRNVYQIADKVYPSNISMLCMLMEVDKTSRRPVDEKGNVLPVENEDEKMMDDDIKKLREDAENKGVLHGKLLSWYGKKGGDLAGLLQDRNVKNKKQLGPHIGDLQRGVREEQMRGDHSCIRSEEDAYTYATQRAADILIKKWINTKVDIIDRLGISEGPKIGEIIKELKQAYINSVNEIINNPDYEKKSYLDDGLVLTREDALNWLDDNFGGEKMATDNSIDIESSTNSFLKFSEYNSEMPNKTLEQSIYEQIESGSPDWDSIGSLFRKDEFEHVNSLKSFYTDYPKECLETYSDILQESLAEEVCAYLNSRQMKTASTYNEDFQITNDPFKDLKTIMGDDIVGNAWALINEVEPGALDGIVYVGIMSDGEELGMFAPEFDNKVKNIYYSQHENVSESEIVNEQKNRKGISLLINPDKIIETAHTLLPESYDNTDEEEMITLVLSEILTHEAVHATGMNIEKPANDEDKPVEVERDFLSDAVRIVNMKREEKGKKPFNIKLKGE